MYHYFQIEIEIGLFSIDVTDNYAARDPTPSSAIPQTKKAVKTSAVWYHVIGQSILSMGQSQLVSSFALYACSIAKYGVHSRDPHASLAYALSLLSTFSQLQVVCVLQRRMLAIAVLRLSLMTMYFLTLLVNFAVGFQRTHDIPDLVGAAIGSLYFVLGGLSYLRTWRRIRCVDKNQWVIEEETEEFLWFWDSFTTADYFHTWSGLHNLLPTAGSTTEVQPKLLKRMQFEHR